MPHHSTPRPQPEGDVSGVLWILHLGVALCFIGHGSFGVITKQAWLPYFAVGGVPPSIAWHLMPWIGTMDIAIGCLVLLRPCRALLVWAAVWTVWTALCRPLAGEGWSEFFERAGNYGLPIALLAIYGFHDPWLARLRTAGSPLSDAIRPRLTWILRLTTATLLAGHGSCGAILHKASLAHQYAVFLPDQAAALVPAVGCFEFALALVVLTVPVPAVLFGICLWKLASESLFLVSGAPTPWFEMMERAGSYAAPLALAFLLMRARAPSPPPHAAPAHG